MPEFAFIDPPLEAKRDILLDMDKTLTAKHINLYICCEKEVLEILPGGTGIKKSACVPNHLLVELFGGNLSLKKDTGQRINAGCGCMVSADIGSYQQHPCYHNCLFCYANPAESNLKHQKHKKYHEITKVRKHEKTCLVNNKHFK